MNSLIWGPHAWHFLHVISFDYPDIPSQTIREKYYEFFNAFSYVLPCGPCRENYRKKLQDLNLLEHLSSRDNLIDFVIKLHNNVARDLGKEEYNREDVINHYNQLYSGEQSGGNYENNNKICYCIVILFVLILIYFIYKKYIIK
jgi:hypothetical protein